MYALLIIGWVAGFSSGESPAFFPVMFNTPQQCEQAWDQIDQAYPRSAFAHRCIAILVEKGK